MGHEEGKMGSFGEENHKHQLEGKEMSIDRIKRKAHIKLMWRISNFFIILSLGAVIGAMLISTFVHPLSFEDILFAASPTVFVAVTFSLYRSILERALIKMRG